MTTTRRQFLGSTALGSLGLAVGPLLPLNAGLAASQAHGAVADSLSALPPQAVKWDGYLERYLQLSIARWNKGVLPYETLADFFRSGRPIREDRELFATGEMWGKAVRSTAMFYRYTGDPQLKEILKKTVADLLSTRRENGTISCTPVAQQPDGPMGEIWERKYVLLGLDEYYEWVERDPAVLKAMMDEADATIAQIGPAPKVAIVDLGWSSNRIESSTILEPIVRLYRHTGEQRYLEFARYIVEVEGGAKHHRLIDQVMAGMDPVEIGGIYPKGYEMLSLFEGLMEYYRVTGNERWRDACLKLFHKVIEKEITIIGNGGGDQPYHPNVMGEAWNNTALEQTNPNVQRMMETCVGVTWLKFCHQVLRLTGDPVAADYIEQYVYNGLIGAMKPAGDGFSYVNLLNGKKTEPRGWGTVLNNVYVTCCNLNGPMGLAYLPYLAVMSDAEGPVVNLYNSGSAEWPGSGKDGARLTLRTNYPVDGLIRIEVTPKKSRNFAIKLRIPAWSKNTVLQVNGETVAATPGTYARIERRWSKKDVIELSLDMRCRLLQARQGFTLGSDKFHALMRGPVVLARDENIDPKFDQPVDIVAIDGVVDIKPVKTAVNMQFEVPTRSGPIQVVDYASVNSWDGKRVQTWLPMATKGA